MPFKMIACHVWALDGYRDDDTASAVNARFIDAANNAKEPNSQESRNANIKHLVDLCRISETTTEQIVVYGGFRRRAKGPEHMWFEYNGTIYETMPGYRLHSQPATAAARKCPNLENEKFAEGSVGQCATFLTVNQQWYLNNQDNPPDGD